MPPPAKAAALNNGSYENQQRQADNSRPEATCPSKPTKNTYSGFSSPRPFDIHLFINAFFSKNKSTEAASSSHANPTSSTATTEAEMGGLEQKQQQLLIALTGVATWLATSGSSTLPPPS